MYKGEYYKFINIGCLIVDVVKDNYVFLWKCIELEEVLLVLFCNEKYFFIVVFLYEYVVVECCIDMLLLNIGKMLLFIFLDGMWCEVKKMFVKSFYLYDFFVLGVSMDVVLDYLLCEFIYDF